MEKEKHILKSMTDFVLTNAYTNNIVKDFHAVLVKHCKYAEFLKQPLTLGMFVPTDKDGNILEDPDNKTYTVGEVVPNNKNYLKLKQEYEEAKERVLFKGWKFSYDFPGTITIVNDFGKYLGLHKSDSKFRIADAIGGKCYLSDVESFVNKAKFEIELTESGARQAGLI